LKAVGLIIKYITKYQNNLASVYLFKTNFRQLLEFNVDGLKELLDSKIFRFDFDFDDWPSSHTNDAEMMVPYNDNLFNVRYASSYKSLFPGEDFADIFGADGEAAPGTKTG